MNPMELVRTTSWIPQGEPFDDGWPGYEEPSIMLNLCWACRSIEHSLSCGYRGGVSILWQFLGKIILIAKCQTCHIFCPYIGLKNVSSAQKGSIWGKIRNRGWNFPDFSVDVSAVQKAISYQRKQKPSGVYKQKSMMTRCLNQTG